MEELHKEISRILSNGTGEQKIQQLIKIAMIYFKNNEIEISKERLEIEIKKRCKNKVSKKSLYTKMNKPHLKKVITDLLDIAKKIDINK